MREGAARAHVPGDSGDRQQRGLQALDQWPVLLELYQNTFQILLLAAISRAPEADTRAGEGGGGVNTRPGAQVHLVDILAAAAHVTVVLRFIIIRHPLPDIACHVVDPYGQSESCAMYPSYTEPL